MMKVLHIISGLFKHTGGPAESVPGLCTELVNAGCEITLATLNGPLADTVLKSKVDGVRLYVFEPTMRNTIWYSKEFGKGITDLVKGADVVHVHGLWEYPMWKGCYAARINSRPLIITPRGSLEPLRLKKSRWKKLLAGALFDNRNLRSAACIHATAESEKKSIRTYGLENPVAVIPNGVNCNNFYDKAGNNDILERFPQCVGKRILLYMSRINPTKGLLYLADAWGEVALKYNDWHLLIVGPDERGHSAEIIKAFQKKGVIERMTYAGPLYGEDRYAAFNLAELFILPTHNENYGIAIAEALASGIPVITTHGAPWSGLKEHDCGWWVPVGSKHIAVALEEALSLSSERLLKMGFKGRNWVSAEFSWDRVAKEMLQVYNWLLGKTSKPGCVTLARV